jgi:hypothetical protein
LISNAGKILINQTITNASQDININSALDLVIAPNAFVINNGGNIFAQTSHFVNNNASATTFAATAQSNFFQIWSTNVDPFNLDPTIGDVRGGLLYNYKQYNAQFGMTTVQGQGNGLLYSFSPVITASLVGTVTKVYDGTTVSTQAASNYAYSNNVDGDAVVLNYPVLGNYTTFGTGQGVTDVGSGKVIQVNGVQVVSASNSGGVSVFGYKIASTTIYNSIGVITPKTLTVLGDQNVNKPVDGFTTMPVGTSGWSVDKSQFIAGDDVRVTGFAAYDSPMVGIRTILVGSVAIVGYKAVDYTLNFINGKGMIVPSQPILEPTPQSLAVQPSSVSMVQVLVLNAPTVVTNAVVQAEVPVTQARGFSFVLPDTVQTSLAVKSNDVFVRQIDDSPLPNWLAFERNSNTFIAQNVPEHGLPIKVQLVAGTQKLIVEIVKSEQAVPTGQLSASGKLRPATLDASQFAVIPATEVANLRPNQIVELNVLQIQKMTPEHLRLMAPSVLTALSPAKIAALTQAESNQLQLNQVLSLNPAQIARINPTHIAKLSSAELANLSDEQLKSLTPAQIGAIEPAHFAALQSEQISIMTRDQITVLAPVQFAAFTPIQISSLTGLQIGALSKVHLQSLNEVQRAALLPEQIKAMNAEQKDALGLPAGDQPTASSVEFNRITNIQLPLNKNAPKELRPNPTPKINFPLPVPGRIPEKAVPSKSTQSPAPVQSPLGLLDIFMGEDLALN